MNRLHGGCVLLLSIGQALAHAAESVDWPAYGGAPGGGHYTAATQIDAGNVDGLEVAWTHRSGDFREGAIRGVDGFGNEGMPASAFTGTPILVNDTLYYCTPFNRVFALDPRTGAERWVFDPGVDMSDEHLTNCRAVSSWTDPDAADASAHCAHRIVLGTLDGRLIALDGKSGKRCSDFGIDGEVDTTEGLSATENAGEYGITSAPAVLGDLVITGSYVEDSVRRGVPSGVVRAYSVRTGEFRWGWNPVPPGLPEMDEAGTYTPGTTNVWSTISADAERNLVIVPTGNSSPDYYGGDRGGNLDHYSSSVVALDGATGELVWHYRTVHHDIWDMDVPAQPTLVDLDIGGGRPAVVQVTKMGMTFVLDLETGEPLHPVEERPVPQEGAVPGEYLSPTQPFPVRPVPLHQLGASPEDAWGFTFWDRNWCRRQLEELTTGPIYTPISQKGTVLYPSNIGGQNWGAPAVDPARQVMVTNTKHVAMVVQLLPQAQCDGVDTPYPQYDSPYCATMRPFVSPFGAPCTKPPWGTLDAVDLVSGELLWRVPLGTLKHQAYWPLTYMRGGVEMGGPMITASGLVFIAASADRHIRAFDIDSGEELWADELPTTGNAVPMSYVSGGRQYVAIAAGGHFTSPSPPGDYLIAYALPED